MDSFKTSPKVTTSAKDTIREVMQVRNLSEKTVAKMAGIDPTRFAMIMDGFVYLTPREAHQLDLLGIAPSDFLLRLDTNYRNANGGK